MNFGPVLHCSRCGKSIVSDEGVGFVCFKTPGKEGYDFFHCRFRAADCWEAFLIERR